ncbi:hypothetical protein [Levilactobacillus brevis]|uniref:hypothetical protein n=1 Tax=Levilactobacillus brevis TaxID=1580 RepID=UPI0003F52CC3|nr:hypothetical protein [Levilactobacillus brevis]KID42951.1 hypothetical protein LbDm2_2183 [Levilactobacillus brevis]
MKNESKIKIDVWSSPQLAGVEWHDTIELPANATQTEIDKAAKEVAFEHLEWGYDIVK